ncbi:MAG: hypothetical protein KDK90_18465 [Leptospiraceae bacterium]|nr:hypothetical protein [Leptospiraceae bacterium]
MQKKSVFVVFLIFTNLFVSQLLLADTIFLNNGEVIYGKITSSNPSKVTIQTKNDSSRNFNKSEIFRIYFRDVADDEKNQIVKVLAAKSNYSKPKVSNSQASPLNPDELAYRQEELKLHDREQMFREEYFKRQMDLLEEELRYLREEREKLKSKREIDENYKRTIERKIANLELRNKRLEKLLKVEQNRLDDFKKSGSPWQLAWRSAILPGWGHRYVGEDVIGDSYSASILVFLLTGFGLKYDAKLNKQYLDEKLTNAVVIRPILFNSFISSSTVTDILSILAFQTYYSYNHDSANVRDEKRLGNNLIGVGAGLYILQIAHAYITGVNIKKEKYSSTGGWNFYLHSLNSYNPLVNQNVPISFDLSYTFRF